MLQDPQFWVAVSFVAFVALVFRPAARLLTKALDDRSDRIRQELETAKALRVEAEEILAHYQKKQRDMLKEAEALLQATRAEADRLAQNAQAELKTSLEARRKLAVEKIQRAETAAIAEVQRQVADLAVAAAREFLTAKIASSATDPIADTALQDIGKKLH